VLSAIVAAGGLLQESVEFVIGAMVIAPLLGPNVAFGLAMVLGDLGLAWRAAKAAVSGFLIVIAVAAAIGLFVPADMANPLIIARTEIKLSDIALALAAGFAASLSYTTALLPALVGVMVAVALLPPLVVFALLLGNANWWAAGRALVLVLVNIVCINLAATSVFMLQQIRPKAANQAESRRRDRACPENERRGGNILAAAAWRARFVGDGRIDSLRFSRRIAEHSPQRT